MREIKPVQTHPAVAMEIVVDDAEAFPGVIAPIGPTHQELNNEADVNQRDLIVWRQMTLWDSKEAKA